MQMLNGRDDEEYTLNGIVFCFPSIAPVLFNRSLSRCSSPSACRFHSALLFVLSKAVPCTPQGKVMCCDISFGCEALPLPLQMSLLWYLGWIPWQFNPLYSFSLAFLLVLERAPAFPTGLVGAMKCCHAEVGGHVALCVAAANPHAVTRRCSGEAVCFLVADGVIAACVLRLCVCL